MMRNSLLLYRYLLILIQIFRYTPEDMNHAVDLVNDGYAVARAAEIAGVPRVTLVDRQGFYIWFCYQYRYGT